MRTRKVHLTATHPTQPSQPTLHATVEPDSGIVTLWEHRRRVRYTGTLYSMLSAYFTRLAMADAAERRLAKRAARRGKV